MNVTTADTKIGDYEYGDICDNHGRMLAETVLKLGLWMEQNGGFPSDQDGLRRKLDEFPTLEMPGAVGPQFAFLSRLCVVSVLDAVDEVLERFNDQGDLHRKLRSIGQRMAGQKGRSVRQKNSLKRQVQSWAAGELRTYPEMRRDITALADLCVKQLGLRETQRASVRPVPDA